MSGNIFKEAILMVLALRKNRDSFIKPRK
jgi:hypothetical protein